MAGVRDSTKRRENIPAASKAKIPNTSQASGILNEAFDVLFIEVDA